MDPINNLSTPAFDFTGSANMAPSTPTPPGGNMVTDPPIPELAVLSTLFIDNMAHSFGLNAVQRGHLHLCAQLGSFDGGLSKADLSTRLLTLAIMFDNANEQRALAERNSIETLTKLLDDLRIRLDDGYVFTKEQLRNIRMQVQDAIYEASRTSFMMLYTEIMKRLSDDKVNMKLTTVFGNPSREKALVAIVKRICSSVRNSLRQDLRNSICGDSPDSLAVFMYATAMKFKRGGAGSNLDVGFTVHNALLRRFARENPVAIGISEVEDEDSTEDHGGGRIAKGKDFWSQVDAFFSRKITEYGSKNLQSSGWKAYTAETLALDEALFPDGDGLGEQMADMPLPQAGLSMQPVARAASWGVGGAGGVARTSMLFGQL
ncbi:hypothetical protein C8R43DRAFT_1139377 [Mycena crocata]|nr:hypothetical protein C8R43DRAFT_1139377 [Mycena crocata]